MQGTRLATIGWAQTCGQAQEGVSDAGYIYPAHLPPLLSSIIVILSQAWVSTVYLASYSFRTYHDSHRGFCSQRSPLERRKTTSSRGRVQKATPRHHQQQSSPTATENRGIHRNATPPVSQHCTRLICKSVICFVTFCGVRVHDHVR